MLRTYLSSESGGEARGLEYRASERGEEGAVVRGPGQSGGPRQESIGQDTKMQVSWESPCEEVSNAMSSM